MFIADFHIHSRYSRATSSECVPEELELWARRKGLALIGTGDFTHPAWRAELKEKLVRAEDGLYRLKEEFQRKTTMADENRPPHFIVSGEISSIYKKNGKVRKVHNLILLPGLEGAESLALRLEAIGNIHSDGRPILGLDSRDLLEITLDICPEAIFIPAHIWTPHFSLFGAYSGFDRIEECFEDLTGHIFALETGLSSDPPMNWRLSALDQYTLVSNSDAHSPANLAREANIFESEFSYAGITRALRNRQGGEFKGTIEFFPEEGKYHYDGHRLCDISFTPSESKKHNNICPVCKKPLVIGVLNRVEELADRPENFVPKNKIPFKSLIPLEEIIADSLGVSVASKKIIPYYENLIKNLKNEFNILLDAKKLDIEKYSLVKIAEGIIKVRNKEVAIKPGFDGVYGKVGIFEKNDNKKIIKQKTLL